MQKRRGLKEQVTHFISPRGTVVGEAKTRQTRERQSPWPPCESPQGCENHVAGQRCDTQTVVLWHNSKIQESWSV